MDVVQLATELVAIDSTTGREGRVVQLVAAWLRARGWRVILQPVGPGRDNVWATRSGGGVTLSTHLDTVPPFLAPRIDEGRLYGRGACDAKGIAAAMMIAAETLSAAGEERVDLLFVVGEEHGSDGALAAAGLPATSRYLVNGEPTESRIATGSKGSLRATLRASGVAAHSAYPELGESAIDGLLDVLSAMRDLPLPVDPLLGATTINVGTIAGGTASNVVPDAATAELMIRLVGDAEPVRETIAARVGKRATVEFGVHVPARRFRGVEGFGGAPVAFTTDAPLLGGWGEPVLFGPGSIRVAHTDHEHMELDELRAAVVAYAKIVRTLLDEEAS